MANNDLVPQIEIRAMSRTPISFSSTLLRVCIPQACRAACWPSDGCAAKIGDRFTYTMLRAAAGHAGFHPMLVLQWPLCSRQQSLLNTYGQLGSADRTVAGLSSPCLAFSRLWRLTSQDVPELLPPLARVQPVAQLHRGLQVLHPLGHAVRTPLPWSLLRGI